MRTQVKTVTPDANLGEALEQFQDYSGERLPVINNPQQRILIGYVTKTDLLLTQSHGLKGSTH
jgi:CBS-domain-containing membrane protein